MLDENLYVNGKNKAHSPSSTPSPISEASLNNYEGDSHTPDMLDDDSGLVKALASIKNDEDEEMYSTLEQFSMSNMEA